MLDVVLEDTNNLTSLAAFPVSILVVLDVVLEVLTEDLKMMLSS